MSINETTPDRDRIARKLHYPEHWDTAAYPTLESAIIEAIQDCSECQTAPVAVGDATTDDIQALIALLPQDCTQVYGDYERGYNKALSHVREALNALASQAAPDAQQASETNEDVNVLLRRAADALEKRGPQWKENARIIRGMQPGYPDAQQASGMRTHTTRSGESLAEIAFRQCGSAGAWATILALNPKFSDWLPPDYFPVGTVLNLPPADAAKGESA
jgi:hypothetical protein